MHILVMLTELSTLLRDGRKKETELTESHLCIIAMYP